MADEKVWGKSPSIKLFTGLWLITLLLPLNVIIERIIDRRPFTWYLFFYLVGVSATLYVLLNHWMLTIATNDYGIRIRGFLRNQFIRWDDISRFNETDQAVYIQYGSSSPITIHTQYLKEKDKFVELLNSKINIIEPTECLQCGALIGGESDHCPTCGWSW